MLSVVKNVRTVSKLQFMNPGSGFRSVRERLAEEMHTSVSRRNCSSELTVAAI